MQYLNDPRSETRVTVLEMIETGKANIAATARRVPQAVLDCFWTLSETDKESRITSVSKIIEEIKKQEPDEAKDALEYCVERLIKGLSSSRKQSRRGYSTLLAELLHSKNVSFNECISLAEKHFGPFKNCDTNSTIAWTLLLACICESGVLIDIDENSLNTFISAFTYFGRQKKFVELFLCELLADCFRNGTIGVDFLNSLNSYISDGETSFDLFVMFVISGKKKTKKDNLKEILDLKKVAKVFSETTSFLPKIHPMLREVCNYYIQNGKFAEFWSSCVDGNLFKLGAKEKISLGFALIDTVLPSIEKLDVRIIFSDQFLKIFMPILSNSKHASHSSAVALMNSLVKTLRETENEHIQVEVSQCFINPPGTILFDSISKTRFLTSVTSAFKSEAVLKWFHVLRNKVFEMENVHNTDRLRICCVQQIANLVKLPSVVNNVTFQMDVLNFFFVYSYFEIKTESKLFKKFKNEISEKLRNVLRESFLKCAEFICLSVTTKHKSQETDVLTSMIEVVNNVLSKENLMFLLPKEVSKLWKSSIDGLKKLKQSLNNESSFQFSVVYILFCFHLFEEPEETTDILNELKECIERSSTNNKPQPQSKEKEPHWADVLADLIISMLPKASFSLRKILVSTFQLISGCITEEVIRQLESALLCNEIIADGGLSEDENKEKSDDSDSDSDMNSVKNDADEDDDDDEEEDEDETDMQVDEEFRLQVASALGPAAQCSDGEESEVYLSDSEMFQLDDALSEAFRSRIKSSKLMKHKRLTQLEFKLKCLDLVNAIITRKNASFSQLLRVAKLLLDVLDNTASNKSNVTLVHKSLQNIRNIASVKRYNVDEIDEQKDVIIDLAKQCFSVCNKILEFKLQQSIAALFSWIVTVGKQVVKDNSWFIDLVMDALKNNFGQKNSCISKEFFEEIIKSHREISVSIILFNKNVAFDGQLRIFKRMDALSILVCCLKSLDKNSMHLEMKDHILQMYKDAIETVTSNLASNKKYISVLLETIHQLNLHLTNPKLVENLTDQDSQLIESSKKQLLTGLNKLDRKTKRTLTSNAKKCYRVLLKKKGN